MILTMEEHMDKLDHEMKVVNNKVDNTLDVLASMNEKLKKLDTIEKGLFGDELLDYPGVIKTLAAQENKIKSLEEKIEQIEQINREQDIAIDTKKNTYSKWFEWGKFVIQTLIQALVIYLIIKGYLSASDALK